MQDCPEIHPEIARLTGLLPDADAPALHLTKEDTPFVTPQRVASFFQRIGLANVPVHGDRVYVSDHGVPVDITVTDEYLVYELKMDAPNADIERASDNPYITAFLNNDNLIVRTAGLISAGMSDEQLGQFLNLSITQTREAMKEILG
ncbi:hypothetical protein [Corynebacterium freiburgense]|uniref:hypothetical protein n=1 Tax=Corynebacterium freiburgense TaxID=556548 RepID=UPI0004118332|nr:hypothetical protein [Corynebacterium freiburgense]WJZ01523.1 hypothetical protein CFREI_01075 [Corynebacterium freiburgense]